MQPSEKIKLKGVEAGAQVNVPTNLSVANNTTTGLDITSSTGTDVSLTGATTELAGLMLSSDRDFVNSKSQANGIASLGPDGIVPWSELPPLPGAGNTNLGKTNETDTSIELTSTTGTGVTLTEAVPTVTAGLLSGSDKNKLDGVEAGAEVNVDTDLGVANNTVSTLDITSSTGTDATIPAALTTAAGLMSAADKTKLDGVEAGAEVNIDTDLGVANNTPTGLDITSSTGTDVSLSGATTALAGLMLSSDRDFVNSKAQANGLASLGADGLVPSSQLPTLTGNTNLGKTNETDTSIELTSSTGTGVTLTEALPTGTAGLLSGSDKSKLDGVEAGAQVNVDTDLGVANNTVSTLDITSSTGTHATIPAALTTAAGLISAADKTKLDGVEAGAQVNVDTDLGVANNTVSTLDITSSTGTDATIPAALTTAAGLMSAADKSKLDDTANSLTDMQSQLTELQYVVSTISNWVYLPITSRQTFYLSDPGEVPAEQGAPIANPVDPGVGWYFTNSSATAPNNKINWYFIGDQPTRLLGDLFAIRSKVHIYNNGGLATMPFISVYTKRLNDGQDAGSWYRSRQTYIPSQAVSGDVEFYVGSGAGVEMVKDGATTVGPEQPTEEILTIAFSTSSSLPLNQVQLALTQIVSSFGGNNVEFNFDSS